MSSAGLDVFDTTLEKTNKILGEVETELGWENRRNQSYLAVRTVLHAVRDRLPVNDAAHLGAQLPILLKGVYYDGWSPAHVPVRMHREEFLRCIGDNFKFSVEGGLENMVKVVMEKILNSIDPGEAQKIIDNMPKDLVDLLRL